MQMTDYVNDTSVVPRQTVQYGTTTESLIQHITEVTYYLVTVATQSALLDMGGQHAITFPLFCFHHQTPDIVMYSNGQLVKVGSCSTGLLQEVNTRSAASR